MRPRDILTTVTVAGVTLALTLAWCLPKAADAVPNIQPVIAQPQFTMQGCTFETQGGQAGVRAGRNAVAADRGEESHGRTGRGPISGSRSWLSAPASPLARMLPMPRVLWSHQWAVRLNAEESQTATLPTDAKLSAGQNIVITLSDKDDAVLAGPLRVFHALPAPPPAFAAAQQAGVQQ